MGRRAGEENIAEKLREAAGRGFRTGGFGGVGVDGIAKSAGLTSGAFYTHFRSKADAFRQTLCDGIEMLIDTVEKFKSEIGEKWLGAFVDFYLGERMTVGLDEACALPTLTTDAARAEDDTRRAYTQAVARLLDSIAEGLEGPDRDHRAIQLIIILVGSASVGRAVADPKLRRAMLADAAKMAKAIDPRVTR